ncbi:MAG: hypothetical protein RJA07_2386 [Bacteroidota bacterium]|jgi:cell division protein FtsB
MDAATKEFSKSILIFAKTEAEKHGFRNMPTTKEEFSNTFLRAIQTKTQVVILDCHKELLPRSNVLITQAHLQSTTNAITTNDANKQTAMNQLRAIEYTMPPMNYFKRILYRKWLVHLLVLFIGLAEMTLSFSGFRYIGLTTFDAVMLSGLLGLSIFIAIPILAYYIHVAPTKRQKNIYSCISIASALLLSFVLAKCRVSSFFHQDILTTGGMPPTNNVGNNPIITIALFLFIFLCFFVTYLLHHYILQKQSTYSDMEMSEFETKISEIQKLKKAIKKHTEDIAKLDTDKTFHQRYLLSQFDYGSSNEKILIAAAQEAITTYITTNRMTRTDNQYPDFFNTIEPFHFETFFNH